MELNFNPNIRQQFKDYATLILFYQAGGTVAYVGQYLMGCTLLILLPTYLVSRCWSKTGKDRGCCGDVVLEILE
jgi:hypothetical protein